MKKSFAITSDACLSICSTSSYCCFFFDTLCKVLEFLSKYNGCDEKYFVIYGDCNYVFLPDANEVLGKVIFSEAYVKNSVHRWGVVLSRHALQQGGMLPGGGVPGPGGSAPRGRRLLLRAVCILLECILVKKMLWMYCQKHFFFRNQNIMNRINNELIIFFTTIT